MLFYSDVNMVKYLLEKGAEIDAKTNIRIPGITPPSPPSLLPSLPPHTLVILIHLILSPH